MMPLKQTAVSFAVCSLVGVSVWLAFSSDALPAPLTAPGAVSNGSVHLSDWRQARRLGGHNGWLPAQSRQPKRIEAAGGDDTILAHFELSSPEGVEEDVAEEYGLELIERSALRSLGMRIARYRLPAVATVLRRLRADRRITMAVLNVQYARHPALQDAEVGVAAEQNGKALQTQQDERRSPAIQPGENRSTAAQSAPGREKVASASGHPPRADGSGEVSARISSEARRTRRICGRILDDRAGYDPALVQYCDRVSSP